jgi:hypothetical protein
LKRLKERTAEKSKTQYESVWLDALAFVHREKERGNKNVIQILDNYHKKAKYRLFESKFFHDVHRRVGLRAKRKHFPAERLAVLDGTYIIVPTEVSLSNQFIDILSQFIIERGDLIDCVVELGSGIGRNLFALAHKLDQKFRKRIMFYACEPTSSGKKVCSALQEVDSSLRISIEHFDYYEPDLSFLPKKNNVLFFTRHSIEQIPFLSRKVLEEMILVSDRCFCYHAEPVGWQYVDDIRKQRAQTEAKEWKKNLSFMKRRLYKADRLVFSKLGLGFIDASRRFGINVDKTDIGKSDKVSTNASSARDFNTNLVFLLKDMEREGLISIDTERVNLFGEDPFNPTTVIAWHNA